MENYLSTELTNDNKLMKARNYGALRTSGLYKAGLVNDELDYKIAEDRKSSPKFSGINSLDVRFGFQSDSSEIHYEIGMSFRQK
mgnify:CR=1 FL=1